MSPLKELEAAVLQLPEKDRLRLTERLLGTLPAPNASRPAPILAEARRRDAELVSGKIAPLSDEQFWAGVRRRRV